MIDTRFQLVLDDIDAAIASRKAADAAIDDARTKLADIADENPTPDLLALINSAGDRLNRTFHRNDCDQMGVAQSLIRRASEVE